MCLKMGCSCACTANCKCPYDSLVSSAIGNAFNELYLETITSDQLVILQATIDSYWALYKNVPGNFGQCAKVCDCEGAKCSTLLNAQVFASAIKLLVTLHIILITGDAPSDQYIVYAIQQLNDALSKYRLFPNKFQKRGICKGTGDCCKNACTPLYHSEDPFDPVFIGQKITRGLYRFCIGSQSPAEAFLTYFSIMNDSIARLVLDLNFVDSMLHYLDLQLCILPPHPLFSFSQIIELS